MVVALVVAFLNNASLSRPSSSVMRFLSSSVNDSVVVAVEVARLMVVVAVEVAMLRVVVVAGRPLERVSTGGFIGTFTTDPHVEGFHHTAKVTDGKTKKARANTSKIDDFFMWDDYSTSGPR